MKMNCLIQQTGANTPAVRTHKRSGKICNLHQESGKKQRKDEGERKRMEKYDRCLKLIEDSGKTKEMWHEMNTHLAMYADGDNLEKYLRKEFIKEKKHECDLILQSVEQEDSDFIKGKEKYDPWSRGLKQIEDSERTEGVLREKNTHLALYTEGDKEKHLEENYITENEHECDLILQSDEGRTDPEDEEVKNMEDFIIMEKEWQAKGEVSKENRPEYSLLEEVLEADICRKPAPVITEQTTLRLEEIVKRRIKDKTFDSVTSKEKPTETGLEYKKKLVLDQEKSKQSLAQIYENEYLNLQDTQNKEDRGEEELALHTEIRTTMADLFSKLDALSNYHFTPKPLVPELRVICNLPAMFL